MDLDERNQKQREFFNEKIDTYDQVHEGFLDTKKALTEELNSNISKVLDLGVGTGLELIYLLEKYPKVEVVAIDISEKMLENLAKRDFKNNLTIIQGDFFKVEFGNNYDAVISTSALHHFLPEEKLILYKKIYNALKDNGLFLNCDKISKDEEEQNKNIYELKNNLDNYKHLDTPLTIQEETKVLENAGFNTVAVKTVDKDNYRLFRAKK